MGVGRYWWGHHEAGFGQPLDVPRQQAVGREDENTGMAEIRQLDPGFVGGGSEVKR